MHPKAGGTRTDNAKLSGRDIDCRTIKEPTGFSDKISVVISLKKLKIHMDSLKTTKIDFTLINLLGTKVKLLNHGHDP